MSYPHAYLCIGRFGSITRAMVVIAQDNEEALELCKLEYPEYKITVLEDCSVSCIGNSCSYVVD